MDKVEYGLMLAGSRTGEILQNKESKMLSAHTEQWTDHTDCGYGVWWAGAICEMWTWPQYFFNNFSFILPILTTEDGK